MRPSYLHNGNSRTVKAESGTSDILIIKKWLYVVGMIIWFSNNSICWCKPLYLIRTVLWIHAQYCTIPQWFDPVEIIHQFYGLRDSPRCGLHWSGQWYYLVKHKHDWPLHDCINYQFLFYRDCHVTNRIEKFPVLCLVQPFVPDGGCVLH